MFHVDIGPVNTRPTVLVVSSNRVNVIICLWVWQRVCFVIATPTGICFHCQEPIKLKFGMCPPCDQESLITLW